MNARNTLIALVCALLATSAACGDQAVPEPLEPTQPVTNPTVTNPTISQLERDLRKSARDVLEAFLAKDVGALSQLAPAYAEDRVLAVTPGTPRYDLMFGSDGWRADALSRWDGSFDNLRVDGHVARVPFATMDDGDIAYVELRSVVQEGRFAFFAVWRTDAASYDAFGERP